MKNKRLICVAKNGFLEKKKIERQVWLDIGVEFGRQQIIDMMTLALRDEEVVGKDIFGKDRLIKVIDAIKKNIDKYYLERKKKR